MKILVTGVAGFIGFHVAKKLLERGDEIIGIDNLNSYYDVNLKYARLEELGVSERNIIFYETYSSKKYPNFRFVKLDLSDEINISQLFKMQKFDAVCHLAAQAGVRYSLENPHAYIDSNIKGFMNILEGCRSFNVQNLCFASSSSVYGLNKAQPFKTSDHTDHPVSLYAATKKSNEVMAHAYSYLYGIAITGLRFFTVYGPWGRPDMAPMIFADAILRNKSIKVFNHGNMSRDFTFIDDVVAGIIKVIDNPATVDISFNSYFPDPSISSCPYNLYNIGNNSPINLMDFIEMIEDVLDLKAQKEYLDMQPGDVESTYADSNALKNKFGYEPKTNIKEGILHFIEWYKFYYRNIR